MTFLIVGDVLVHQGTVNVACMTYSRMLQRVIYCVRVKPSIKGATGLLNRLPNSRSAVKWSRVSVDHVSTREQDDHDASVTSRCHPCARDTEQGRHTRQRHRRGKSIRRLHSPLSYDQPPLSHSPLPLSRFRHSNIPEDRGDGRFFAGCGDAENVNSLNKPFYLSRPLEHDFHPQLCSTLSKGHFTVFYNNFTRTPCWVYEYLTPDSLRKSTGNRKKSKFQEDREQNQHYGASLSDYRGSGYDRGHVAAAGNHRSSQDAVDQTFLLSNILPQVGPGFNRDIWRHLEEAVRNVALQSRCVHLYTGPLYLSRMNQNGRHYVSYRVIGGNRVAVPTHLFKTLLIAQSCRDQVNHSLIFFIMPNIPIDDSVPVEDFIVTVEDIRRLSGMQFFSFLRNDRISFKEMSRENHDNAGLIEIFRARRR